MLEFLIYFHLFFDQLIHLALVFSRILWLTIIIGFLVLSFHGVLTEYIAYGLSHLVGVVGAGVRGVQVCFPLDQFVEFVVDVVLDGSKLRYR